jgi:hypothetical protein
MCELFGCHLAAPALSRVDWCIEMHTDASRCGSGDRRIDVFEAPERDADPIAASKIEGSFQVSARRGDIPDPAINDPASVRDFRSKKDALPCGEALIFGTLRFTDKGIFRIGHIDAFSLITLLGTGYAEMVDVQFRPVRRRSANGMVARINLDRQVLVNQPKANPDPPLLGSRRALHVPPRRAPASQRASSPSPEGFLAPVTTHRLLEAEPEDGTRRPGDGRRHLDAVAHEKCEGTGGRALGRDHCCSIVAERRDLNRQLAAA